MSTVGRMDGAFFVSRSELMAWVNTMFRVNVSKVEQCSNGALYCQVIDACHPGSVAMKKVNWNASSEHQSIPNFKILQQAFDRMGIQRHVEVDKLIRGKYQDNLEMLQWIKTYFDRNFSGGEYDAASRRFGDLPVWARSSDGCGSHVGHVVPPHEHRPPQSAPKVDLARAPRDGGRVDSRGGGAGYLPPAARANPQQHASNQLELDGLREDHERLREEIVDLKITVDGLETERDFYFQKLRDIEILCQTLEAHPDSNMTLSKFVEDVQRLLYAKDDEDDGAEDGV